MLSKEVFKEGIEKLLAVYPKWGIKSEDPGTMKIWYDYFQDMTDGQFAGVINKYITTIKVYPTVAGLQEQRPRREAIGAKVLR